MVKLGHIFREANGEKMLDESIIDPQKNEYAPIFTEEHKIKPEIKKQIYSILRTFRDHVNFKFEITAILLKGSLLTKRWVSTSDLDVTVATTMSIEQRDSIISILPQGNKIEGTDFPIDFYVLAEGEKPNERNLDNIYNLAENKWIKQTPEYSNDIPIDYTLQVANFFINGCSIAITNFENDKILFHFYKGLDPKTQEISEDEKKKAVDNQLNKLNADLDGLRIANHMLGAFRQEAYADSPAPFSIQIELTNNNPHNTINENMLKLIEKLGLREKVKLAITECEQLINAEK